MTNISFPSNIINRTSFSWNNSRNSQTENSRARRTYWKVVVLREILPRCYESNGLLCSTRNNGLSSWVLIHVGVTSLLPIKWFYLSGDYGRCAVFRRIERVSSALATTGSYRKWLAVAMHGKSYVTAANWNCQPILFDFDAIDDAIVINRNFARGEAFAIRIHAPLCYATFYDVVFFRSPDHNLYSMVWQWQTVRANETNKL